MCSLFASAAEMDHGLSYRPLLKGLKENISLFPLDRNSDLETSTVHRLMHVTLLLHMGIHELPYMSPLKSSPCGLG